MDENISSIDPDKRRVFRASLNENNLFYEITAQNSEQNDCDIWGHFKKSRFKVSDSANSGLKFLV